MPVGWHRGLTGRYAALPAVLPAERPQLPAEQLEHPEPLEEVEAVLERVRLLHRL